MDGLCHGDDGIQKHLNLSEGKSRRHPVLGSPADGLVFHGKGHTQQQGRVLLSRGANDGGRGARRTPQTSADPGPRRVQAGYGGNGQNVEEKKLDI
jgi:hypothetical protein